MDLIFKVVITAEIIALFCTDIAFSANCPNIQYDVPTFMNCKYRCHCKDEAQCDEQTGKCTNGCDFGWMGPGCQYRNIVKNNTKTVRQNRRTSKPPDFAGVAVDGDNTTCSRTGNPTGTEKHYWYISFDMTYEVLGLRIEVPPQDVGNFRNFHIDTGERLNKIDYPTLCYCHTNSSINTTMEIMCRKSIKSKRLRIKLDEPGVSLSLCEVEIYGGRSVTFNKHSSQISTYKSPTFSWSASKAVDGRIQATASDDANRTCSAAGYSSNPWWRVDLDTPYVLYEIQFYGRLSHLHQFQGFYLQYSNSTDQFKELFHDNASSGGIKAYRPMKIPINPRVTGKYWQFQFKKPEKSLLVVCEVVAFAECLRNKCGWDCSENCSCSTEITGSYKIDGRCPYGCQGRWTGVDGKCDHECTQTQWGPTCQYKCGHCEGTQTCDVKTGYCKEGCSGPWVPPLCSKDCPKFKYGINCSLQCGNCFNNNSCNSTDGTCDKGCQPGWKPPNCKTNCKKGSYGYNCKYDCGNCLKQLACDIRTGECNAGCDLGYHTIYCNETCPDGLFGFNCSEKCGFCKNQYKCDKKTGHCLKGCQAGYKWDLCKQRCDSGKFGFNCSQACGNCLNDDTCHLQTGICEKGCKPGFQTTHCNKTCDNGYFGLRCARECGMCKNEDYCDKVTGLCPQGCQSGWKGVECLIPCPDGLFGFNCSEKCGFCKNQYECDKKTGHCLKECQAGYKGDLCKQRCDSGNFGFNCIHACGNCINDDTCHLQTGICEKGCKPGFQTTHCNKTCDNGYFGLICQRQCGMCKNEDYCDKITGLCPQGCQSGWKGVECLIRCDSRTFGFNCSRLCGQCINDSTCHFQTGICEKGCKAGFQTAYCNELCDEGTYGEQCKRICGHCSGNDPCDSITGVCQHSCAAGYTGRLCNEEVPSKTGLIMGAAGAVVVIVTVIAFIVVVKRKRRQPNIYSQEMIAAATTNSLEVSKEEPMKIVPTRTVPSVATPEENVYGNAVADNNDINVAQLRMVATAAISDPKPFYADFEVLPYGLHGDVSAAKRHNSKNKYKNVYPYNFNRVILPSMKGVPDSSYINASYINGFSEPKKYIAAQGPIKTTIDDIWRMVWSHNVRIIVMLTNCFEAGKSKCEQYWPNEHLSHTYGNIRVDSTHLDVFADFCIRKFKLTESGTEEQRTVIQFHYTAWPDKDVPDTALSLVQFWRAVRNDRAAKTVPWIVHCSAGVGRTGTFIGLDFLYEQGGALGVVNVKGGVNTLRQQRVNMVQTKEQYVLLHETLAEVFNPIGSIYKNEEFVKQITALVPNSGVPKKALQDEYTAVCASSQAPVQADNENVYYNITEGVSSEAKKPINLRKSRYPDIYPDDLHRPLLSRIPIKGHNDFINAVFVSTFRQLDRLILTQVPLNNTVVDFVRMLWDTNTSTIVLLEDSINDDCCYWPLTTRSFNIGPIKCDLVEQKQCDHYMVRTLKYTTNISYIQDKEKVVRQFHVNSWFPDQAKPETTRCILGLVSGIEGNTRFDNQSQIIIQCMDGAKKSGLFCVLWSVIERMRSERKVCMAETVRLCRRRRRQIIHDFEQYTYCYNAVKDYLDNVELYSNLL